jgi:phospholipid transport system substrate-binding protein
MWISPHDIGRGRPGLAPGHAPQRQKLQDEFKALLIRTYAGRCPRSATRPLPSSLCACARRHRRAGAHPGQRPWRPRAAGLPSGKAGDGWKIYNFNVLGVWLVETYRNQFAQEINANGIDGLIKTLASRSSMPATPPTRLRPMDAHAMLQLPRN